jgi:hypothetical protein
MNKAIADRKRLLTMPALTSELQPGEYKIGQETRSAAVQQELADGFEQSSEFAATVAELEKCTPPPPSLDSLSTLLLRPYPHDAQGRVPVAAAK